MTENVRKNRKLSTKQRRALEAMLEGCNQRESAMIAGVSARTVRRWCDEDVNFSTELERCSQQLIPAAKQQLIGTITIAVDLLRRLMIDETTPASVRIKAANSVLAHTVRFIEIYDLDRRLKKIEKILGENENAGI